MRSLKPILAAIAGCLALIVLAVPVFSGGGVEGKPQYTPIQWAILSQGSLVLIPVKGRIYPAEMTTNDILESYPPKIRARLYWNDNNLTPPVHHLLSPFDVVGGDYTAEILESGTWRPATAVRFDDPGFALKTTTGTAWVAADMARIRFRRKN